MRKEPADMNNSGGVSESLTRRIDAESRLKLSLDVAGALNRRDHEIGSTLGMVVDLIREAIGFEAVGLRMRKDDDFPYCVHRGFSDEFVNADTLLCARRADGTIIRNGNGTPALACTCGMVLGEHAGPELPYFTEGGSFWTNHFSDLFQPDRDPRTSPRDTCRNCGYQSMALIPIRSGREILGLLQLHDSKAGRLDLQMVRLFECLAGQIGLALRCRRAEEELYKSEEQLRLSIEHAPTNIAMFDRNMCYLAASRRWLEDHNLAGKPFVGLNLYETADQIPERWKRIHQHCLSGGVAKAEEEHSIDPDGRKRWWRWETRPWHSALGQVGGIIIFSEEITAARTARETLAREREVLQAIMNGAKNSHLVYLDPDFNFVFVNETYARTAGYTPSELIGKNHFALFPNAENEEIFRRVRDTGEPVSYVDKPFEYPGHPERGVTYWNLMVSPVKDKAGSVIGLVCSLYDTTERKRSEELLQRAKEELEARVRERTEELSRTVATLQDEVILRKAAEEALRQRTERLRELAAELTEAEQRERRRLAQILHDGLQQILVGAKYRLESIKRDEDAGRLASEVVRIIDEAIKTSRSLTAELSPPILYQSGLIPALQWLVAWMSHEHNLEVDFKAAQNLRPTQPDMTVFLFLTIRELLFNVIKHAAVRSARVEVTEHKDRIRIVVEDQGAGFDRTQLRYAGGRAGGFGLFYINERIGMLGGKMMIDSAPGKGTRIEILAPLPYAPPNPPSEKVERRPKAHDRKAPEKPSHSKERIRVVLVDDHAVMRQGLRSLLKALADIEIVGEASNGEAAVHLIRSVHPDVVLMDVSMPGMDGIQATRIVHSELPDVQVIGLSMFQEKEQAAAMREAGAVDYLTKSGPSDSVVAAIRACAARKLQ